VIFIALIIFTVVIPIPTIYLNQLESQKWQERWELENIRVEKREFKNKCSGLCEYISSLDYCRYYFEKDISDNRVDWDRDGEENELIKIGGDIKYNVCEDRIYCFHIIPCERFGENPIEGCAEQLCQEGYRKYGSISLASDYVINELDLMPTKDMECKINMDKLPDELNWHKTYFPENVCEKYIETK